MVLQSAHSQERHHDHDAALSTLAVAGRNVTGNNILHHIDNGVLRITQQHGAHHIIDVAAGSTVEITEDSRTSGSCSIIAREGANVTFITTSNEGAKADRFVVLRKDAQLKWIDAAQGGSSSKCTTYLAEPGANAQFKSVFLGMDDEQYDVAASMVHAAGRTQSNMLTRAVLMGRSRGTYRGLIRILPHAKGCEAYQRADALLLGDSSRMDAEPLLEIENDDVKCSHGVAIGQVDDEQLFYMASRGIPTELATSLLVQGFLSQVLESAGEHAQMLRAMTIGRMQSAELDVRKDFPILDDARLVYLDSGASTQKPKLVLDGMRRFYENDYANVHRGIYALAERATAAYEVARERVAAFINAEPEETIFTRGTTDGINMIARSLAMTLKQGDEILVSAMEHHSNFVPWQQLALQHGCTLKTIDVTPDSRLDLDDLRAKLSKKTRIVAMMHVSNVLGTINPVQEIARLAHDVGALLVVDGAQAVAHMPVDVKALDVDFYAFSGHKLYGPEGIGVLYGKRSLLLQLSPSAWGGEMVGEVKLERTTWNELPYKFEPGTPPITQAVGLGIAIDYLTHIGMVRVRKHEQQLLSYLLTQLQKIDGLHIIGPSTIQDRSGAVSFVVNGMHPHDLAQLLDSYGIAVRAGNHCAQPLHCTLGLDATTRASIGVYTTRHDIDALIAGISKARAVFR